MSLVTIARAMEKDAIRRVTRPSSTARIPRPAVMHVETEGGSDGDQQDVKGEHR